MSAPLILPEADALEAAMRHVLAGEAIAVPTETVYGLAADATSGAAVARIFEAKGRPRFNPLIAHVGDVEMALRHGDLGPLALQLAERFWPGPLTMVVNRRAESDIHDLVTAGLPTLGLRNPVGFASRLIRAVGRPLAAPSANASGKVSPTSAAHVAASLGGRVPMIVDGGASPVGVESTIVRVSCDDFVLLRPGGVSVEELEAAAGRAISREAGAGIQAPGMMASHYAPGAAMRLDAGDVKPGEALLAFGPRRIAGAASAVAVENLSPAGDLREAAANLFAMMQRLDRTGAATITVEPIPHRGLGEAINDRLARAAAPRDTAGFAH